MPDMFELDKSEFKVLLKFLKKAPFQFRVAHGRTLNALGFHLRGEMIKQIKSNMTIRKPKFVEGSFRVETTRVTRPIDQQRVEVGSINRRGFTGYDEQQKGTRTEKKHTDTLAARGGSYANKMMFKAKFLKGGSKKRFITEKDYKGKTTNAKIAAMYRDMSGPKKGTPFALRTKTSIARGIYVFNGNKLLRLRTFDKAQQPKRLDWAGRAMDATKRNFNFKKVIFKEAEKQLPFLRRGR